MLDCEKAVLAANQDPDYLRDADPAEVSVTGFVSALMPLHV